LFRSGIQLKLEGPQILPEVLTQVVAFESKLNGGFQELNLIAGFAALAFESERDNTTGNCTGTSFLTMTNCTEMCIL